uniref:Laminin G domain-containing protein n=1 Tax=Varanus komodoensis TaxID=61221 RepID=A0A8D2IUF3_VARKO
MNQALQRKQAALAAGALGTILLYIYVQLNIAESSSTISLKLHFQTSKPDGLLFLAAGKEAYFLVELHSGNINVRLNFGGGEQVLSSHLSSQLNDLVWHLLEVHHERDNIALVIDNNYQTSTKLLGTLFELKIEHGIFVGGSGELRFPYFDGVHANFRGCMKDLLFNHHDILASLRPSRFKKVHEVSLSCSEEFFAGDEEPISFFSSKSYVSFPRWNVKPEGVLAYTVQTTAQKGLLLYSSGTGGDFIAMEIENGCIKVHVRMGDNRIQLSSLRPVNDSRWHLVKLKFFAKYIELTVQKETVKTLLPAHSVLPVLEGALYIGGINDAIHAEVLKLGLVSVSGRYAQGGSFRGCLKDLNVDSERNSFKNVLVTRDISVGCRTESDISTNANVPIEILLVGTTPISAISKLHGQKRHVQFLVVNNLIVPEGGQAALESKHIKVNVEFKKLGIRQSQILFKIKSHPSHGHLRLNVDPEQEESTFTMLDLWQGRVLYVHDGSEESYDYFTFSISTSSKKEMPPNLQGNKEYMFTITVRPINDAPELTLPNGNLFFLLEYSKKCLSVDLINITDSDTDAAALSISVLGSLNADAGFLENSKSPGKSICTFSYTDLQNDSICFVHTGVKNSRIVLRASDGEKISNTVVLRVVAVPLEFKLVNNTGVDMLQGSAALIRLNHLAFETNAFQQDLEVRYEITEPPHYGEIQKKQPGGEWKKTNSFPQHSLERGRVRYVSTFKEMQQDNALEYFKFKVGIGSKVSEEFLFPIMVKWLRYNFLRHVPLVIDKSERGYLSSENLLAVIAQVEVPENELHYRLQSLPEKGKILLNNVSLQINSTFSQQDISDKKVEYQLISRPLEDTQDSFQFLISTQYVISNVYDFKVSIKTDPRSILLTNRGLTVTEGEGKLITTSELFAQTLDNKTFQYKVTRSPRHGKLMLINFSDSPERNNNLSCFTNQDIIGKRLMYVHDDSETQYDEIDITATAIKYGEQLIANMETEAPLSTEIKFNISIQLKNDEKPVRVVDKVFHVVKNGRKLLTLADLCYHDPDTDFDDSQLLYTRRGIPNGELVLVNETSHGLYQFKQEDLAQKRVLFIHHGPDYGRFVLFITDGKHYTSSLLEVSASSPYIRLENNTGLLIQKGREGTITAANLSATTNQDIRRDDEIVFEMFTSPRHGNIFVNNLALGTFTQHDLKIGHVTYRHDDSNNLIDTFNFTVYAKGVQLVAEMNVCIFLESHQRSPVVVHNSSFLVEEGKPVKINKGKLLVVHENSLPSEIEFKVQSPPAYGYLRKFTSEEGYLGAEENPVLCFTQQDINDGNIQYVQTVSNQLQDQFSLDVTNGIRGVSGIEIVVDIIPKLIPLEVQNFTVAEGGLKALEEDFLKIPNKHFVGVNCEFHLIGPPKCGHIANSHFPGVALAKFTKKQVEQGLIFYVHDDSKQLLDNFTIVANSTELWKHSLPQIIFVTITPVNDDAPVIRRNNIFRVITAITMNDLCTEDKDSTPAELLYSVSPPSNGHLALKSSPNKPILNFTQAHIEEGQLVFVHNGMLFCPCNCHVRDIAVLDLSKILVYSLKAVTNDVAEAGNRTILFTVTISPKLGRLITGLSGDSTQDISSFTQSMVRVLFTVGVGNQSLSQICPYCLLFLRACSREYFRDNSSYGAVVQEGGHVLIYKTNLDGSNLLFKLPETERSTYEVWYQVIMLPQHGRIVVGERNITREKPNFSQYIINKFGITYVHDDSESLTDQFIFAVWLNKKSKSATKPDSDVLEEAFNITVVPVNDQAPELKTKALHLNVLQGDKTVIGHKHLKVEDLDNTPEEIKYTIIRAPSNGYLALQSHLNESIKDFSQADIDGGRVWFVQDGSSLSGVFYFSVTDGKHRPLYKMFNLEVIPMSVILVNLTEVVLPQGQNTVGITNTHLSATTNGKNSEIGFIVTEPLQYGHLLIGNEWVTTFQQADLYSGRLAYCMTDLTAFRDSLEFTVFTSDSNLTGQILNITVQPLVHLALDLSITNGMVYNLKLSDVDTTQLANLTNSNPSFEVIVPPAYGRVLKRSLRNAKSERVAAFTQNDISSGIIFLEADANMTGVDAVNDSFTFILRADTVQPAKGQFHYAIAPQDPSLVQMFTPEVPNTTSANMLKSYTVAQNESLFFPKSGMHTEAPVQSWWRSQNHWGHLNDRDMLSNEEVARGRSAWAETTTETSFRSTWVQPTSSSNRFLIIIILVSVAVLFIVTSVALCIFLMCHKMKQTRPFITERPAAALSSPGSSAERSLTVPTVTVTPLLKDTGQTTVLPDMALRQEQCLPVPVAPAAEGLLQNVWSQLDPEMVQHCRKTNPTLKRHQYWV